MKYIILDKTANHERIYIDCNGENCELLENAEVFESMIDVDQKILENNWNNW